MCRRRANSIRQNERSSPNTISTPVHIPGQSPHSVSPPLTPPLLGSPLLTQGQFAPRSPRLHSPSISSQMPMPPVSESLRTNLISSPPLLPFNQSPTTIRSPSLIGSPALQSLPRTSQNGLSIPGLVLPQSALPYRVAEV